MKKLLLFILMLSSMLASAQTVSDVRKSGCLDKTFEEINQSLPTIVLTKEGVPKKPYSRIFIRRRQAEPHQIAIYEQSDSSLPMAADVNA